MTFRDPYDDGAQPICPACGITMHPLLDEGVSADECRECGFQVEWPSASVARRPADDDDERDTRWDD